MSVRSVSPPLCSLPVSHAGARTARAARRVVRRRSFVRARRVRACVLARRGVPRKEEKRVPAKEEQNNRSPKQERSCVRAARLGMGYPTNGGIAPAPVGAQRLPRLQPCAKNSSDSSPVPVQRRQLRARARAQTAVLVPAAACGDAAAPMQLRARARRARTAAAVPAAACGDTSASSRRRPILRFRSRCPTPIQHTVLQLTDAKVNA